jgi:hypothetical protein
LQSSGQLRAMAMLVVVNKRMSRQQAQKGRSARQPQAELCTINLRSCHVPCRPHPRHACCVLLCCVRVVINVPHKRFEGDTVGKQGTVLSVTHNGWIKVQVRARCGGWCARQAQTLSVPAARLKPAAPKLYKCQHSVHWTKEQPCSCIRTTNTCCTSP